ncbi:tetratricopeptide repeat protein [Spiractinospora alimapuensis]|uniref:ATP-binding protein n=1 Tax=Spiractinospora alimapuensis TaxID=2820884 RepID=UPI001F18F33D|nr:BTAD domain-containing putative transcriptional regulator [Spiractinospora alimapuensis]QVQ50034.1 tetratricopeptide repeat protein [Spiractinospora alimapuensis]
MRFGVLGPLAVWTDDHTAVPVPEALVRRLLGALLLADGGPVGSDGLADALWGDDVPATMGNALQAKVSRLRHVLDRAEPNGRKRLSLTPAGYHLELAPGDVDAVRFAELVRRARADRDPTDRARRLDEALGLWRGPVLAEFRDEAFVAAEAERLDEAWLAAVEDLAAARLDLGDPTEVVTTLAAPAARHPFRERLHALRMRALYRAGQQASALEVYHETRRRLGEDLGVAPGAELQAVYSEVLNQEPVPAPTLPEDTAARGNIPVPLTELVGRDDALAQLTALTASRRLVTLVGTGGVGKTRLATATAHGTVTDAWFVDLGGLDAGASASDIAGRVSVTLGIRGDTSSGPRGVDTLTRLTSALAARETLVVLDNCEHVVAGAAEFVQAVLSASRGAHVLATSREPLGVAGETVWTVPPLDLPPAVVREAPALTGFAAARLFLDRVSDTVPGFTLAPDQVPVVAAICRKLDGLPLALEIAASLMRGFSPHEMLDRLDDRFRLLSSGKHGVPARQRTLRALIDWSWDLLAPAERAVLRRLSVHRDGCTLASAETVCSGAGVTAGDVPALLARLVDQSLVNAEGSGTTRYRLLESVAAYGRERLADAGETTETERRHRVYYRDLVERADLGLRGPDQCEWLSLLDTESANTDAALERAIATDDAEDARRIAVARSWYGFLRGHRQEARTMLDRALRTPGAAPAWVSARARAWRAGLTMLLGTERGEPNTDVEAAFAADDPRGLARARWFLAYAEFGFGDLDESERLLDLALAEFERSGDQWGTAAALSVRADQALFRGDLDALRADAERGAALFVTVGDQWGHLAALGSIGVHHEIAGDTATADDVFAEGERIAEYLGLWPDVSTMLARRGRVAMLRRDHERADELLERARKVADDHGDVAGQEFADVGRAMNARRQGRWTEAESLLRRWLEWNRKLEADYGIALILAELGFLAEERGDADAARRLHRESLAAARRTGDPRAVALALEGLAGAASLSGDHSGAAYLLGTAHSARRSANTPLPARERADVDRSTTRARAALGDDVFTARFAIGTKIDWRTEPPTGERA